MKYRMILAILTFPMIGCSQTEPVVEQPLFCDLFTDPFRWTYEAFSDMQDEHTANLRRMIVQNSHHDAECAE